MTSRPYQLLRIAPHRYTAVINTYSTRTRALAAADRANAFLASLCPEQAVYYRGWRYTVRRRKVGL